MEKFNTYYGVLLFFVYFLLFPLNNLLINLSIHLMPSTLPVMGVVALGLFTMLVNYKKSFELFFNIIPLFTLFTLLTITLLILESYVYRVVGYVPSQFLNANNLYWILFSIGGYLFTYYLNDILTFLEESKYITLFLTSLPILVVVILVANFSFSEFITRAIFADDSKISFQLLSDLIAIVSFVLIAKYFYNNSILITIGVFILLELFILGSRSSIFFYLISVILLFIKTKRFTFLFLVGSIALMVLFYFLPDIIKFYGNDQRVMSLFSHNYLQDASLKEREMQLIENMKFIKVNWLTGGLYSEFKISGAGTYIHNYLSYLQNYGIVPFIIINVLILKLIYNLVLFYEDEFEFRFIFMVSIFTLFSMLFSRSYMAYWILLTLAMSEAYFGYKKYENWDD